MTFWQRRPRTYRARGIGQSRLVTLNTTQAGVAGFDLDAYQAAHVVLIGAGGIGSHVASSLIRKGIGQLTVLDDDRVELKNLTRQLFAARDVGRFKAVALAQSLRREALFPTRITAIPRRFGEAFMHGWRPPVGAVLIAGIDNNPGRREITEYALEQGHTVLHSAVSGDAQQLYVFVQRPGGACWACAFHHYLDDGRHPCGVPGIVDTLQVVSGLIVFALDSVIGTRTCDWNKRQIVLDGSMPDQCRRIAIKPSCPLCAAHRSPTLPPHTAMAPLPTQPQEYPRA